MPQHVIRHLFRRTRYVLTLVGDESGIRHRVPFLQYRSAKAAQSAADRYNAEHGLAMTHWEVEPDGK